MEGDLPTELRPKTKKPWPEAEAVRDLDGIRTHDHLIKSQVLYRLSYEIINYRTRFKKRGQR